MKKSKNLTEITINNKKQYVVMGTGLRTLGLGMLNTDNIKEKMKMGDDKMEKFELEEENLITVKEMKLLNGDKEIREIANNFINNMIIHFREELKFEEVEKYIIEQREEILKFILKYEDNSIENNFFCFLEFKYGNIEKQEIVDKMTFDEITVKDFCQAYGMVNARKYIAEHIKKIFGETEEEKEFLNNKVADNLSYNVSMLMNEMTVNDAIEEISGNEENYYKRNKY